MTQQEIVELKALAAKYPDKDEYQVQLLDSIERLLTNSRDQTKYLRTISTILVILFILSIIVGFFSIFI